MELKKVGSDLVSELKMRLQQQGYNLSLSDLAYWLERTSPKTAQRTLGFALDLVKPFVGGLGLNPIRQSDDEFEFEMNSRPRNLNSRGHLHIGAILGAATEVCELFLQRHGPVAGFSFQSSEQHLQFEKLPQTNVILKLEWPSVDREKIFLKLQKDKEAKLDFEVLAYDRQHKYLGRIQLSYLLKYKPRLTYQKSS